MKKIRDIGISKNIRKTIIDDELFVRVVNTNSLDEIINTIIYKKVQMGDKNVFKEVLPYDIPYYLVNKINTAKYESMEEYELKEFLSLIDSQVQEILNVNQFEPADYLKVGNVCNVNYYLVKDNKFGYYCINSLIINEYGKIVGESSVPPSVIPYILMKFIEENEKINRFNILVAPDTFVCVFKDNNKYLVKAYILTQSKNLQELNLSEQVLCTLVMEDEQFLIVRDFENDLFLKTDDLTNKRFLNYFLKNVGIELVAK